MNVIEASFVVILLFCGFCYAQGEHGRSTRYWDCCKPSCGWLKKADFNHPVWSCAADGLTVIDDFRAKSGCDSNTTGGAGIAFSCANNQPWAVSDTLSYGFVAANIAGQDEEATCCVCYEMTFTSGPVTGQQMIVQVTNSGADLGANQFDIQMPGGGVGIFNGCTPQYGAPTDGWGSRYGGVGSREECSILPSDLQPGCHWRFDWFKSADNPEFDFHRISCPSQLTDISGCIRDDEF